MKNKSLVSIGLPIYNGESFLAQALASLTAQTHIDLEIIISDNNSTDNTQRICQKWLKKDHRIKYFRQVSVISPLANFNFVLSKALGKYFMWAADDDLWSPKLVEDQVNWLIESGSNFVIPKWIVIDIHGIIQNDIPYPFITGSHLTLDDYLSTSFYSLKANAVYGLGQTKFLQSLGGFNLSHTLLMTPDNLFMHKILSQGKVAVSPFLSFFTKREVRFSNKYINKSKSQLIWQALKNIIANLIYNQADILIACYNYLVETLRVGTLAQGLTLRRRWLAIQSSIWLVILYLPADPDNLIARKRASYRSIISW